MTRNLKLDVLRGIAILLVLGRHLPEGTQPIDGPAMTFARSWYFIGWSGVDLFFVLSGFLVSRLLYREYQKNGSVHLGRFLVRRGLRIWPAYYFMTFICLMAVRDWVLPSQVLSELFFLQSYVVHLWDHTWSLAVEEHYYLVFGALAWFLSLQRSQDPFKPIRGAWGICALGCLLLRMGVPYGDMWPFARTHLRMDALMFGSLLGYYDCFHRAMLEDLVRRWWFGLAVLSLVLLSPIVILPLGLEPFLPRFGFTLITIGFGILVLLGWYAPSTRGNVLERGIAWMGVRSYSIYLWHYPVLFFLAQPWVRRPDRAMGLGSGILIYLVVSALAGWASYAWIERPFLKWRDARVPAPSPVAPGI